VKPDLTFFIDANAETISSRAQYGMERYEKVEFQKKVAEAYGKFKEQATNDEHWVTVKADGRGIEDIF
jgi:dTMP kinase